MKSLGVNKPDVQPKATDHINEMIEMIKSLVEKNAAYLSINMFYSMLANTNIMENYQEERRKNKLQEAG